MKNNAVPRRQGRLLSSAVIVSLLLVAGCASHASSQPGSMEEAEAMLERAVLHYEQVGREQALADFNAPTAPFINGDLYVFCYGPERTITAHGVDPALLGVDIDALRDVDGTAFATEMVRVAQASTQGGRSEYKWRNPATGRVERKICVVRAVGTEVCGVGAYQGD